MHFKVNMQHRLSVERNVHCVRNVVGRAKSPVFALHSEARHISSALPAPTVLCASKLASETHPQAVSLCVQFGSSRSALGLESDLLNAKYHFLLNDACANVCSM